MELPSTEAELQRSPQTVTTSHRLKRRMDSGQTVNSPDRARASPAGARPVIRRSACDAFGPMKTLRTGVLGPRTFGALAPEPRLKATLPLLPSVSSPFVSLLPDVGRPPSTSLACIHRVVAPAVAHDCTQLCLRRASLNHIYPPSGFRIVSVLCRARKVLSQNASASTGGHSVLLPGLLQIK